MRTCNVTCNSVQQRFLQGLGNSAVHGKERADARGDDISIGAQASRRKRPATSREVVRFVKSNCKRVVWVKVILDSATRKSTPLGIRAWGRLTIGRRASRILASYSLLAEEFFRWPSGSAGACSRCGGIFRAPTPNQICIYSAVADAA